MKKILKIIFMGIVSMGLIGCSGGESKGEEQGSDILDKNQKATLTIWSHYDDFSEAIEGFNKTYPNIEVKVESIPHTEYIEKYKSGLSSENGPDLLIIDSNDYSEFNTTKSLENLLKPEYGISKYEENFDKELWQVGKSIDDKELLGIAFASAPMVTYYRADILEEYGFPSDPEELGEFMEDKDNWLEIARALKKDDKYILQWIAESTKIYTADMPYYNEKLEYQRINKKFMEGIELAKEVHKDRLFAYTDIWSDLGRKYLAEDKLVMLYLGSWGADELKSIVPEQEGKWRATRLPFGQFGWNNASIISMNANSKNKELAAKFIEYYSFEYVNKNSVKNVPGYLPLREEKKKNKVSNEFLGGQDEKSLYDYLMSNTEEYKITPFDSKAFLLWDELIDTGLQEGLSVEKIMDNIEEEEKKRFKEEKEIILKLRT